jgi:cell division protein FtsN
MTQDYAKEKRNKNPRKSGGSRDVTPKKKAPRNTKSARPNTRNDSRNKTQNKAHSAPQGTSGSLPGWLWLTAGLGIGLFIGGLYHLATVDTDPPNGKQNNTSGLSSTPASQEQKQKTSTTKQDTDKNEGKTKFEFYTLLPEAEMQVDADPIKSKPKEKFDLYLQTGSFKNRQDAEKMRAELILQNMTANIESNTNKSGTTWHRVVAGPFESRSAMAKARSTLASNRINALVLKRKPKD